MQPIQLDDQDIKKGFGELYTEILLLKKQLLIERAANDQLQQALQELKQDDQEEEQG